IGKHSLYVDRVRWSDLKSPGLSMHRNFPLNVFLGSLARWRSGLWRRKESTPSKLRITKLRFIIFKFAGLLDWGREDSLLVSFISTRRRNSSCRTTIGILRLRVG